MDTVFQPYYEKSIRLAPDGFSFFRRSGRQWTAKSFSYKSNALVTTEAPAFFGDTDCVNVVVARHIPMLVPAELYDAGKDSAYLNLQFDTSQLGESHADTLGIYRAVYFLTKNETDILRRLPFACNVVSEASLFFRFLQDRQTDQSLFLALNNGFVDILALNKGEVALLNRFQLVEPTDILCYIYNIMKQCNMRQPDVYLHFFAEEDKKLVQLLKSYHFNTNIL